MLSLETRLQEMIKAYYQEQDWCKRGERFFELDDVFERLHADGYESKSMTQISNIIVLG